MSVVCSSVSRTCHDILTLNYIHFMPVVKPFLIGLLLGQFSWVPSWVVLSFAEVPAGYVLWCRCTAELHKLNDEYTRVVSGTY